ncbi:MAG: hypothetical protein AB9869_23825 [Verrucomicrobiia bacterium]
MFEANNRLIEITIACEQQGQQEVGFGTERIAVEREPQLAFSPVGVAFGKGVTRRLVVFIQRLRLENTKHQPRPESKGDDKYDRFTAHCCSGLRNHFSRHVSSTVKAMRTVSTPTPESSDPSDSRPASDGTNSNPNPVAASLTAARKAPFSSGLFQRASLGLFPVVCLLAFYLMLSALDREFAGHFEGVARVVHERIMFISPQLSLSESDR